MPLGPLTIDVAIVGGGFSGTMLAAQLARRGVSSVIVEKAGRVGRGTAFSTLEPRHLLNVPASAMSAWPDRPGDFVAWLEANASEDAVGADGFAQRRHFGAYLGAILDQAIASGLVHVIDGEAVTARPSAGPGQDPDGGGWRVTLRDGAAVVAQAIRVTRQTTLDGAFLAHPNRFKGKKPQPHSLPTEVWINPPAKDSTNLHKPQPNTLN